MDSVADGRVGELGEVTARRHPAACRAMLCGDGGAPSPKRQVPAPLRAGEVMKWDAQVKAASSTGSTRNVQLFSFFFPPLVGKLQARLSHGVKSPCAF